MKNENIKRYKTNDLIECFDKAEQKTITCELCGLQIIHKGKKIRSFFWYAIEIDSYYCKHNCSGS